MLGPKLDRLDQGAVLDDLPWGVSPAPLGVVLTSACDLENDKVDFVVLAAMKPAGAILQASREYKTQVNQTGEPTRRQSEALRKLALDFVNNASIRRYFLVDAEEALGLGPLFVDFQQLLAIPIAEAQMCSIVAGLGSPLREHLVTHFASYSSRIGVNRPATERANALVNALLTPQ